VLGDDSENRIVLGCAHDYVLPLMPGMASLNRVR
jgi:hypothetical protein